MMNPSDASKHRALRRLAALALAAMSVSGCVAAPSTFTVVSYAMDGASYAATGKSVTDHLISEVTAKDCAMSRVLSGQDICKEKEIERRPDGTPVPNAQDVAIDTTTGREPAHQDFPPSTAISFSEDADEILDLQSSEIPDDALEGPTNPPTDKPEAIANVPQTMPDQTVADQAAPKPSAPSAEKIEPELRARAAPVIPVYPEALPLRPGAARGFEGITI